MTRTVLIAMFLSGLVLVGGHAQAAWTITQYEVVEESKGSLDPSQILAIETTMNRYAQYFEKQGWPQPRHEHLNDTGDAFVVVVKNYALFGGEGPPRAATDCHNPALNTEIQIDPRWWGRFPRKDWQDLAHEIFHTIQYNYPPFNRDCRQSELGHWVMEGTAEAVGVDVARAVLGVEPYHFCQIGLRDYNEPLYIEKNQKGSICPSDTYATSSFWRFLGEWQALKKPPRAWSKATPDYRYLQALFRDKPITFSVVNEYTWLDQSLRETFGFGLKRAYSAFAGTFIGFYQHREERYPPLSSSSEQGWMKEVYGGCQEVTVSAKPFNAALEVQSLAARCIKAHFLEPGQHQLEIVATGPPERLNALSISLDAGLQRVEALLEPEAAPTRARFSFTVNVTVAGSRYLIVTNVDKQPANTQTANIVLDFVSTLSGSTSAAATTSDKSEHRDTSQPKKEQSHSAFSEESAQNRNASSWRGSVYQRRLGSTCEDAFTKRVCGEHTQIKLRLEANSITALTGATDNLSIGTAVNRAAQVDGTTVTDLLSQTRALAETEGSEVTISMPLVRYGFTGQVDNAYIQMNKALSDREGYDYFDTRGPEWMGECQGGQHAFSGKVTIEQASETLLRGRFEADVVEPGLRGKYFCRTMPVYRSISGTFTIANPRLRNEKDDRVLAEGDIDHVINEVAEQVPGVVTPELRDSIAARAQRAQREKAERRRAKAEAAALAAATCDCSCQLAGQTVAKPGCYEECEASYQQCQHPSAAQIRQLYTVLRPASEEETIEFAQLREQLLIYLEQEPKQYVRDTWVQQFDNAPHFMKRQLFDQVKDRYAPSR
ncbi:MAG: hypothetical protein AAF465_10510 [Pseudomonadota bacterium]